MTEESIFAEALAKKSPAERTAFLDETCGGDAELRRRVEALIASHQDAGSFMEFPAVNPPAGSASVDGGMETVTGGGVPRDIPLDFLKPSDQPGHLGRLGDFEVLEVVGQGGMGLVFKAIDEPLHRVVAIKTMAPELAMSAGARVRFQREARAAAAVAHEHVVAIHMVGDLNGRPCIVMQYVDGESLQQRLDRSGPLELKEILRIAQQTASGLAAAHAQGLIHRDIKPANILLENGIARVKITDFGLARAVDDASVTQSGVIAGTPMYMSPEQAAGEPVDHRADLFSLGSVLYAMCTGHPPFRASGTMGVLKRVIDDTPRPIREINPEIPDWLCAIIAKLHAKKPADRFQSAREVADLLEQHLAHLQQPSQVAMPAAVRSPPAAVASTRQRRWPVVVVLVLLAPLFLVPVVLAGNLMFGGLSELLQSLIVVAAVGLTLIPLFVAALMIWRARMSFHRRFWSAVIIAVPILAGVAVMAAKKLDWNWLLHRGTLTIEANDPGNVQIVILQGARQIAVVNPQLVRDLHLGPGEYEVVASCPPTHRITAFTVDNFYATGAQMRWTGSETQYSIRMRIEREAPVRLTVTTQPANSPTAAPSAFVSLFNGRNLTGWRPVGDNRASVAGGAMRLTNQGQVRSEKAYENYVFRCEFRYGEEKLANESLHCYLHMDEMPASGKLMLVELFSNGKGRVFPSEGAKGRSGDLDGKPRNRLEWNRLEVTSQDGTLDIALNGELAGRITGCEPRRGYIGLSTTASAMEFRNLEIKELPSSSTEPRWVHLFNGHDLTGWKPMPAQVLHWRVEDFALVGSGPAYVAQLRTLRSDFTNFHLRTEMRLSKNAVASLLLRHDEFPGGMRGYELELATGKGRVETPSLDSYTTGLAGRTKVLFHDPEKLFPLGGWFVLELIAQGERITVRVNGEEFCTVFDNTSAKGQIGFKFGGEDTRIDIRSVAVKELPPPVVPKETADLAQLQGVWKSVALGPTHVDVVFSGDQFELKRYPKGAQPNEEFKPEVKGAFKLDMGLVAPQRFQIVDPKSGAVTHVGVYRLEGNKMDSLSLCYRPAGTEIEYPVFFATDPPTRTELLVLKRSAKAPADK